MSRRQNIALFSFILFIELFLDTGCDPDKHREGPPGARERADQTAAELGLPADPGIRRIASSELPKYSLQLDVFRESRVVPPLGTFQREYIDILVPDSSLPPNERIRVAEIRFRNMAKFEFAVLSRDGIPLEVTLVSVGESAPDGNFRVDVISRSAQIETTDGRIHPTLIPFPWLRTAAIPLEPMTWGLWMGGGYFIQSTPYYADLGFPSINGGVHQSLPDAMNLYTLVQSTPSAVRIHSANSGEAASRLRELTSVDWILPRIDENRQRIAEVISLLGPEIRQAGHGWVDPKSGGLTTPVWPQCGIYDCFKSWPLAPKQAKWSENQGI